MCKSYSMLANSQNPCIYRESITTAHDVIYKHVDKWLAVISLMIRLKTFGVVSRSKYTGSASPDHACTEQASTLATPSLRFCRKSCQTLDL